MTETKTKLKAFRIAHGFRLPGGRTYSKTSYYQAETRGEEELLGKAMFAHELEQGTPAPPAPPPPLVVKVQDPEKDPALEEKKSDEPDWAFQSITAMRSWLDKAGVMLPVSGSSKDTHEQLCRDAWTAGRRPHPLYGFPGGPVPSPGEAGPLGSTDPLVFAQAIEAAISGGFEISLESRAALEGLNTDPEPGPEAPAKTPEKAPGEAASKPDEPDEPEPAQSTNETVTDAPEGAGATLEDDQAPKWSDRMVDGVVPDKENVATALEPDSENRVVELELNDEGQPVSAKTVEHFLVKDGEKIDLTEAAAE